MASGRAGSGRAGSKAVDSIDSLRKHATAVEAAITIALAKPRKEAVHRLRTLVRRLEAQIELLSQLEALSPDSEDAANVRRELGKLRRAAGRVRDLDVQRELLKTVTSLPEKAANELRDALKKTRNASAKDLQSLLIKRLPRIAGAIEQMVQSIGTANGVVVPDLRLIPLIEKWSQSKDNAGPVEELNDDQLHDLRKVSKSARYMAESGGGSAKAKQAAARYEELQDAGGRWHDWTELEETARAHFGKKHPLTLAASAECAAARVIYVELVRGTEGIAGTRIASTKSAAIEPGGTETDGGSKTEATNTDGPSS